MGLERILQHKPTFVFQGSILEKYSMAGTKQWNVPLLLPGSEELPADPVLCPKRG